MRKNWLVTVGGIMAGFLAIPIGVATLGYQLPEWLALTCVLVGMVGGIVTGVAAKGQDEHSTAAQVQTATIENPKVEAAAVVQAKVAAIEAPLTKPPEVKP